jgi:uncharacterized membrane protein HdeD (DUF308 family)
MSGSLTARVPMRTASDAKRVANHARARFIAVAGGSIIILGIGAALSPLLDHVPAAAILGSLLVAAGIIELIAGLVRHETRVLAASAGCVTVLAGGLLVFNRNNGLLPNATIVSAWLLTRSVILMLTSRLAHGSVRKFLGFSAATDFVLGAALLAGLSVSTLVVTIFGPSPQLLASYGWVLALSFIATGTLLLEVASCESEAALKLGPEPA